MDEIDGRGSERRHRLRFLEGSLLRYDLAGNGLSEMNFNAALSGFDSRMLLTLARTVGSLSSL